MEFSYFREEENGRSSVVRKCFSFQNKNETKVLKVITNLYLGTETVSGRP